MPFRLDLELVVLDHVVGQKLLAHRLHTLPRLALAARLEAHLDVLADADVGNFAEAKRRKALLDGDALRVVHDRLGCDDDAGDQVSFLGFGGNNGLPTKS